MAGDELAGWERTLAAGDHLAEHMAEAPVLLLFVADPTQMAITDKNLDRVSMVGGGSVYTAVQNAMLACRAEGLGCTLTTLHCIREPEVKAALDIPDGWATLALLPIGYPVGRGHGPITRQGPDRLVYDDALRRALDRLTADCRRGTCRCTAGRAGLEQADQSRGVGCEPVGSQADGGGLVDRRPAEQHGDAGDGAPGCGDRGEHGVVVVADRDADPDGHETVGAADGSRQELGRDVGAEVDDGEAGGPHHVGGDGHRQGVGVTRGAGEHHRSPLAARPGEAGPETADEAVADGGGAVLLVDGDRARLPAVADGAQRRRQELQVGGDRLEAPDHGVLDQRPRTGLVAGDQALHEPAPGDGRATGCTALLGPEELLHVVAPDAPLAVDAGGGEAAGAYVAVGGHVVHPEGARRLAQGHAAAAAVATHSALR